MTAIEGPTSRRIAAPTRPGAGPARASGFRLDMPAPGEAHAAAAPLAAASLAGLLALQEEQAEGVGDRRARRHGQDILAALARLQREMLAGGPGADTLAGLATLAAEMPAAEHPGLAAVLAEIRLRVAVELAHADFTRTSSARTSSAT